MEKYKELAMLIVFLAITFYYYDNGKDIKKIKVKETTISNDYAQAYDYCIKIRLNEKGK